MNSRPVQTADDYKTLLALLLPLVSYNLNGEQLSSELGADTNTLSLADAFIADLLTSIDPREATNLLGDWERVMPLRQPVATICSSVASA